MKAVFAEGGKCVIRNVPIPVATASECLVKIRATAVNRADTLQRKGLYPPPPGCTDILGLEMAGEVVEIGSSVTKWSKGDRVMSILGGGGYAQYASIHENLLVPVPSELSWQEAAAIPEAWMTAFQLLHLIGKVKKDETVLIHAGGSGVGTAATQLAVSAGAHVIVTAGSDDKIEKAKQLGAIAGINYKLNENWATKVKEMRPNGIELVLDCIGGSYWEQNAEVLGIDGRWVVYGLMGGQDVNGKLLRTILSKRLSILGTTLRNRPLEYKAELAKQFSESGLEKFKNGSYKTIIDRVLKLEEVDQAHEIVESNSTIGKVVLLVE